MFWAVIKANLKDPCYVDAFHEWYNKHHMPLYVGQPGFRRGWRLQRVDRPGQKGAPQQEFLAIYEVATVQAFNDALKRAETMGEHPWEEWEERIVDWQRTYCRLLLQKDDREREETNPVGRFWSVVRVDFEPSDDDREAEFNRWYNETHIPEVCSGEGFFRAWRLVVEPDDNDLGPREQKYWAVYETETPDYVPQIREGKTPWDGVWTEHIRNWELMMYRVVNQDLSGPAW